ncbi:GNAT family N-acetyltransferase [Modestobacter sp. KNN46-3]|uniref:GNAT family N-acetyltransferase n=1 Tax=Modestobacter sp. KNN46-3 TaxID=2711218 RepID=UPI0019D13581|nr:GNAT family N-acetyltransferase [Modestobacter sp. KNN46-3]
MAAFSVRPIVQSEAADYLRVLPFINGLPQWEPAPAAWHGGAGVWPRPGRPASADELEQATREVLADHVHTQAAFDGDQIVGASAMLSLTITVPGLRAVPAGGVTSTGVRATHRRRGVLRAMMQAMFDAALARGEPLAALSASEGGIYGRFGFAPATIRTRWEIERADTGLLPHPEPAGSLVLADAEEARAAWPVVHRQVHATRNGEVSSTAGHWRSLTDDADGDDGPLRYLLHRDGDGRIDGIADYRLPWSPHIEDAGTLVVERLEATTDDAYRSMWALLLDFDLTKRVVAAGRPTDEPLRWMLRNPRALRVTRQSDNLWLRLLDVPAALTARAYDLDADLTFTVPSDPMCPDNVGTWLLDTRGPTPTCRRVQRDPDLTIDVAALGALYLGGNSAALLTSAGHIRPHTPDATHLLSRLFRTDPPPHNAIGF